MESVKVTVRLEPDLRRQFRLIALKEGTSMQQLLHTWVTVYVRRAEDNAKGD